MNVERKKEISLVIIRLRNLKAIPIEYKVPIGQADIRIHNSDSLIKRHADELAENLPSLLE